MLKDDERLFAQEQGGKVTPFGQTENVCRGYVAWWLRRRLKLSAANKPSNFFQGKHFDAPVRPGGAWTGKDDEERSNKPVLLANSFRGANAGPMHDYVRTGGFSGKADKPRKDLARVGGYVSKQRATGFCDQCAECLGRLMYVSMAIEGKKDGHAIGLDLLTRPQVWYFDPNLAEIVFPSMDSFQKWWAHCYAQRQDPPMGKAALPTSAFGIFGEDYEYEIYTPL